MSVNAASIASLNATSLRSSSPVRKAGALPCREGCLPEEIVRPLEQFRGAGGPRRATVAITGVE